MNPIVIISGILFSFISCAILAYTSMATPVGPWIAPTIILISLLISNIMKRLWQKSLSVKDLIIIQGISAGGGIMATGIGFALPMLYFLDPETFNHWLGHPFYFFCLIGAICISAGALGLCVGRILSRRFVDNNSLPFPVSTLTYNIATTNQQKQTKSLLSGVLSTLSILVLRDGVGSWSGILPKTIYLFPSLFRNEFSFSFMPMFWAIGSTMGFSVILPILVGLISRYIILYPINNHAEYLPFSCFQPYQPVVFIFAFCSGILIYEVVHAMPSIQDLIQKIRLFKNLIFTVFDKTLTFFNKNLLRSTIKDKPLNFMASIIIYTEPIITLALSFFLLSYFKFSILAQISLIIFTVIATYHICFISAEIGLLQLGRFAMLIMLPMYLLFDLSYVQITICCVFFNVCAAVASDFLFDYKTGLLCGISKTKTHKYQILGLLVSAACLGLFFWLLFTSMQVGSSELFAQKARAKAALLQTIAFDPYIIAAGFLFAWILKRFKISPAMTFGGLIMPNNIIFSLLIGALIPMFLKNRSNFQFFCAGAFSSESIWVFASIIGKIIS